MTAIQGPTPTGERAVFISEITVLPRGAELSDDDIDWSNLRSFLVHVKWTGPKKDNGYGGYAVKTDGVLFLSRAGKWAVRPDRFRTRQYRFDTLNEALAAAERAVDGVTVNGRTWAQWQQLFAERANSQQ